MSNHNKEKEVLWVTPKFKSFLYERKSKDHKKTFYDIQEDIINELKEKEEKEKRINKLRGGFFGRI